ncbi:sensor histidine kinase [Winogradskyella sp.]|uniref:sensor histidine kinase n=1 Tax=Winogradskyella sp. TaxID=1883156 RepID=UPI0026166DDB|nr:histidine kinase [Winogradskyella sp.]
MTLDNTNNRKVLTITHAILIAYGLLTGFIIHYYTINGDSDLITDSFAFPYIMYSGVLGLVIAYFFYAIFRVLNITIKNDRLFWSLMVQWLLILVFSVLLLLPYLKLMTRSQGYDNGLFIKCAIIVFVIVTVGSFIQFSLLSFYQLLKTRLKNVSTERKMVDLQLKTLKQQLGPHFLFNALNSVSGLMLKNSKKADFFLRNLSKIYHNNFNAYDGQLRTLKEELDLAIAYLNLLKIKHPEFLYFSSTVDDAYLNDCKLPPLALQILIENAVKHNIMDDENILTIELFSEGKYVIVKNNITQSPKEFDTFKLGLSNLKHQYKLISNQQVIIDKGRHFSVKLPLIK